MIIHQGIYLPDHERHLQGWMDKSGEIVDGRGTYQIKKLRKAIGYCEQKRCAIDIGAHVGLWSMQLAKVFERVIAFEPMAAHQECFRSNLSTSDNVELVGCALGEADGLVQMETEQGSSGHSIVSASRDFMGFSRDLKMTKADGNVPLRTLDGYALAQVDFIKLDCEGYELFALKGAKETIEGNRPVIIVEQKPGRAQEFDLNETGAVQWLEDLGYQEVANLSGDYIMCPEEQMKNLARQA